MWEVLNPELCPLSTLMIRGQDWGVAPVDAGLSQGSRYAANQQWSTLRTMLCSKWVSLACLDYTKLAGGRIVVRTAQAEKC